MESIYLTTAINYTNGPPHIGHAYEAIITDVLARWHRLVGRDVKFLTGTDEHGQKIAKTAEKENLKPKQLCDRNVALFKKLDADLKISYDFFIRTTDDLHMKTAQEIFKKVYERGDIYLGKYEGWYNPREERFITESEAKSTDYKDPTSGDSYQRITEPSYFFRLEPYRKELVKHITESDSFLEESRKNEILKRLERPLDDLSISRTSFDWGIPIDCEITKEKHIMYVWFDALTNYLSGIDHFNLDIKKSSQSQSSWWNSATTIHIIGKDILWFHAVIWPCILLSTGIALPEKIIVHGFINDSKNEKMSKSLGNGVDPNDLLTTYTSDQIRYYLIREGSFGQDLKFSEDGLKKRNDSELADLYGNLVARFFSLIDKFCQSKVPQYEPTAEALTEIDLINQIDHEMIEGNLSFALDRIVKELRNIDRWIYEKAPWSLKKTDQEQARNQILSLFCRKMCMITFLLSPFIPDSTMLVFGKMGIQLESFCCFTQKLVSGQQVIDSNQEINCEKLILFKKYHLKNA